MKCEAALPLLIIVYCPGCGGLMFVFIQVDLHIRLGCDVLLFKNSIGRTDLGGDENALWRSLKQLYDLPGDYDVYPGHDDPTTLSDERRYNPYLKRFGAV